MTISNAFTVRIVANTTLGTAVAATSPGTFSTALSVATLGQTTARLDTFNEDAADYPNCAGGQTTNGYSATNAWAWGSRGIFDTTTRRALTVASPHPDTPNGNLANGYTSLLTVFDETDSAVRAYESPFSNDNTTYPRSVAHIFDNQCIVGRTLYKMTNPYWVSGSGYVQPQIAKIDLDQITDDLTSAREGQAYLGSLNAPWEWDEDALTWVNPGRNLTAGALEYLPGCASLMFFHKKYLSFAPTATETWTQPVELPITGMVDATDGRTKWAFHNLACYNPNSGLAVCGGGAYNPDGASNHRYSLQWFSVDGTTKVVTELDQSPVIMSVSETDMPTTEPAHLRDAKCAMCYDPNSNEFLFFHDNLTVYGLDPGRPPGYQWRVVRTMTSEVDWVCAVPDYGVILCFLSAANGGASVRIYKPASVPDVTPPAVPLNLAATATGQTTATITWSASSDQNVQGAPTSGIAGYRLYRDGVLLNPGPVGLVTSFNDTGLSSGTTYSYTIAAYDAAGNASAQSAADTATTTGSGWQLAAGHFMPAKMTPVIIHPRPNTETQAYARCRKAPAGYKWSVPIVVQGGAWPLHYELVTGPSGMTIGQDLPSDWLTNGLQEYGVLSWQTPTIGTHAIHVRVTDQDGTVTNIGGGGSGGTWTLEVIAATNTAHFMFLDAVSGNNANAGTPSAPKRDIASWYGTKRSTTYANVQVYYFGGSYNIGGLALNGYEAATSGLVLDGSPQVHVAVPGQSPAWRGNGSFFKIETGTGDGFWSGFDWSDIAHNYGGSQGKHCISQAGNRFTVFRVSVNGGSETTVGGTNSSLFFNTGGGTTLHTALVHNQFTGCRGVRGALIYGSRYGVFEGNRISGPYNGGDLYLKAENISYWTVRANVSAGLDTEGDSSIARIDSINEPITERDHIETCWNSVNGTAVGLKYGDSSIYYGTTLWSYRNSYRVPYNLISMVNQGTFTYEYDAIQHNGSYTEGIRQASASFPPAVLSKSNLLTATSGLLNATTNLLEPAYAANRGTHGCEVA